MSVSMPTKVVFYDNNTAYWESTQIYLCKYNYINISNNFFMAHIYIESLNIHMYVTYEKSDSLDAFVRGFLYKDNKEYEILSYCRYVSLQIGNYGYDNISTCKLPNNIF
jgi:hypothetical protein